jgi:two-component system, OmpR family, phosphate regulon response regulator PhoB
MSAHVLVVDPDPAVRQLLELNLTRAGHRVDLCPDAESALAALDAGMPDMLLLEWDLPGESGEALIRRLHAQPRSRELTIIMVSQRAGEHDKILALESGADDYLTKPFNPRELVARVKSILRRTTPDRRDLESETIEHGDLHIDAGRREVRVGEDEIQLAPKEFDLLWELLDHRGLVLTRDQLLERVWGYTFAGDTRTVDVHVRQLRRKLGDASPIVTVWGVGYKVSPAKDAKRDSPN